MDAVQLIAEKGAITFQLLPEKWAYIALAVLVFVEGPLATLLGAAAAASGWLDPYLVFVSAAVGNFAADNFWYFLGYIGKVEWVLRYGRWLGVQRRHVEQVRADILTHAVPMLLLAKLTATFAIPALVTAGLIRVPWRRTFTAVFVGECLWTGLLVFVGYHFAASIRRLTWGLQVLSILAGLLMLLVIVRYLQRLWWRQWHASTEHSHPPPEEE